MAVDTSAAPQSRRALLAGALGGLAAALAAALGRPGSANAAAGSTMIIGSETNNAGSANTQLLTNSNVVAFKLLQNGPGTALMGYVTPATGETRGVYGRTDSPHGFGVQARNAGAQGFGAAIQAIGVNNKGLDVTTDNANVPAVYARNNGGGTAVFATSTGAAAISGAGASHPGVQGTSTNQYGVLGAGGTAGVRGGSSATFGAGVEGVGLGTSGHGVAGSITADSGTASGVYGASAGNNSYAGYFDGHVTVTGTLSKGGGSFRIDHPLDPANRILQHSFVESPDMLNIYNGVATADANGEATVSLPAWFGVLNRDFRYGLTPIGEFAPLYIKAKVARGRFTLGGARPGQEISWQLTGIRKDAWAEAHRVAVELDKTADQRGRYLHPVEHGQPTSKGVDYPLRQRLTASAREQA